MTVILKITSLVGKLAAATLGGGSWIAIPFGHAACMNLSAFGRVNLAAEETRACGMPANAKTFGKSGPPASGAARAIRFLGLVLGIAGWPTPVHNLFALDYRQTSDGPIPCR